MEKDNDLLLQILANMQELSDFLSELLHYVSEIKLAPNVDLLHYAARRNITVPAFLKGISITYDSIASEAEHPSNRMDDRKAIFLLCPDQNLVQANQTSQIQPRLKIACIKLGERVRACLDCRLPLGCKITIEGTF